MNRPPRTPAEKAAHRRRLVAQFASVARRSGVAWAEWCPVRRSRTHSFTIRSDGRVCDACGFERPPSPGQDY